MLRTIILTHRNEVPIHTYTSLEAGCLVNTHIIELPTQLLVVDAQSTLTFAREVVKYAETLEKPITRVYISHHHPDHLLGAAAFSAPLYALAEVTASIWMHATGSRVCPVISSKGSVGHAGTGRAVGNPAVRPGK